MIHSEQLMGTLIDISIPMHHDIPRWPGSTHFCLCRIADLANGDNVNESVVSFNVHTGTHLDAPLHFIAGGSDVTAVQLDVLVGPCLVADFEGYAQITAHDLEKLAPDTAFERILFKTDNSRLLQLPSFCDSYCALTGDAAQWIADRGIRIVGIDYLSIAPFHGHEPVHEILLTAGIPIIEGVDLSRVSPGEYELVCLPIPISGAEAAPCRVLLRGMT
jgi:arylformamidase